MRIQMLNIQMRIQMHLSLLTTQIHLHLLTNLVFVPGCYTQVISINEAAIFEVDRLIICVYIE